MSRAYLVLAALAGCAVQATDADEQASTEVATALDSSGELARLVQPLEVGPDLGGDIVTARMRQLVKAQATFDDLDGPIRDCIDSDLDAAMTRLTVAFRDCTIAFFVKIDGTIVADVDVEADGNGAPAFVRSTVTVDLTFQGPFARRSLNGSFTLRQPVQMGAPVEFDGDVAYSDSLGGMLNLKAGATWTVTQAPVCVNLSGGAELSGASLGELGPISLAGDEIRRCQDQCPSQGHVELSYGRGNLLAWDYTGQDTAVVRGPRGKVVTVKLPCSGDAGGSD
jgi:hypothetical protein